MCKAGNGSMVYFYFYFRDVSKQRLRSRLCLEWDGESKRIIAVGDGKKSAWASARESSWRSTSWPSDSDLAGCLKEMLTLPDQRPAYLVIDALDESPNTPGTPPPRERVPQVVRKSVEISAPNLRNCVTSRPEIDIQNVL